MTDNDKLVHQRPLPADEPESVEDEDARQANRLAVGFAIFIPLGIVLGLIVFDNVGVGVAIGLAMGAVYSFAVPRIAE